MRLNLHILALALVSIVGLVAPGYIHGSGQLTEWSVGAAYPAREYPGIHLEQELVHAEPVLSKYDVSLTVMTRFKNSGSTEQSVSVVIPIITLHHAVDPESDNGSPSLVELLLGTKAPDMTDSDAWKKLVASADGKRRELSFAELDAAVRSAPANFDPLSSLKFEAIQDGTIVPVDRVVLTGRAKGGPDTESPDLEIAMNIQLTLRFPAASSSMVTIQSQTWGETWAGQFGLPYASNSYLLGAEKQWSGGIGELYVVGSFDIESSIPGAASYAYPWSNETMMVAKNVVPAPGQKLRLEQRRVGNGQPLTDEFFTTRFDNVYGSLNMDGIATRDAPKESVYDWVDVIGASSALAGQTVVVVPGKDGLAEKVRTGYGPEALFDGISTNAWVEGVAGSGEGQYVEIELKEPAFGLIVYNGLEMLPVAPIDYDPMGNPYFGYPYPPNGANETVKRLSGIWEKNNRVKDIEIARVGGPTVTLTLDDSSEPKELPGFFAPGRYRVTIKSVYRGTTWDDTCLGEMIFKALPGGKVLRESSPEIWQTLLEELRLAAAGSAK